MEPGNQSAARGDERAKASLTSWRLRQPKLLNTFPGSVLSGAHREVPSERWGQDLPGHGLFIFPLSFVLALLQLLHVSLSSL